jgi:RHS repeat-associated protein
LVEAYEYYPYGRHRVIDPGTDATFFTRDDTHAGSINNSVCYTGQRFDEESNLMAGKNGYDDPTAGRFIGRDPLWWLIVLPSAETAGGWVQRVLEQSLSHPHERAICSIRRLS